MATPTLPEQHKFSSKIFIPGHGWKYNYAPGLSSTRVPTFAAAAARARSAATPPGGTAPPTLPSTPSPQTPPPPPGDDGMIRVGDRVVPRAEGKRARRSFRPDGGPDPDDEATAQFVAQARGYIRKALFLYAHERCALGHLPNVWSALEPHLDAALEAGVDMVVADKDRLSALFKAAKGNAHIAGHLAAADRWIPAAHAICAAANVPQFGGELARIARPRSGWPAFDAAMRELSEMRRGTPND